MIDLVSRLDSEPLGALGALLLGVLVAIDPCTLGTSITAVGYIGRTTNRRWRILVESLLYALGRAVTYSAALAVTVPLVRRGLGLEQVELFFARWGGWVIGPLMILFGIALLIGPYLPFRSFRVSNAWVDRLAGKTGLWGSFLLGLLFALAACPAIALIFFGGLVPLIATARVHAISYVLLFSLGSALPVALLAAIVAFSLGMIEKYYRAFNRIQKVMLILMALLFILAGIQVMVENLGNHDHEHDHDHGPEHHGECVSDQRNPFRSACGEAMTNAYRLSLA